MGSGWKVNAAASVCCYHFRRRPCPDCRAYREAHARNIVHDPVGCPTCDPITRAEFDHE